VSVPVGHRLVALGDSFSCGVGVGVTVPGDRTWVGLLGTALGARVDLLAAPGLASREVLAEQVPRATRRPAAVATLLVGLNDVVQAAFDPIATRASVHDIIDALCAAHGVVLVARLHDAIARLPVSHRMHRRYAQRIAAVNRALDDAVGAHANAVPFDLAEIPALRARCAWAVDRVHPSRYGHQAIASAALAALRTHGWACPDDLGVALPPEPTAGLLDEVVWFVGHGGPWLARRLPKVVLGTSSERIYERRRRELDAVEPCGSGGVPRGEQLVHR
jgi:lysophospholipase L1-like esterase